MVYNINVQGTSIRKRPKFEYFSNIAAVDHRKWFVELTVDWPGSLADRHSWNNLY